ncbi:hypothetical protein TNCV_2567911 [Trichonephila clavipes]|uniref:Transposase n=1 Tax=Trichonephila clavipes TaxID=2585209 RepID=A0A8X7BNR6_TRICX|nr:hypothetical protein TNCV_2567911 [Trichonephila clavipes]
MLPHGQTLNSDLYCQQLDRLKLVIDQKWPELANRRGVVFYQDNARPHTSGRPTLPEPLVACCRAFGQRKGTLFLRRFKTVGREKRKGCQLTQTLNLFRNRFLRYRSFLSIGARGRGGDEHRAESFDSCSGMFHVDIGDRHQTTLELSPQSPDIHITLTQCF